MRAGILLVLFCLLRPSLGAEKYSILAVFAHPDDETTVSPLLARYAKAGHAVYLAAITSGQKGATPHSGIPAGDQLGAARENELRCACKALGIHEPFLLQFQDQGISVPPEMAKVLARLREIINQSKPAVVITWGPDGFTGHPDHRAASNLVTEVFQQQTALAHRPRKLYYVAFPESRFLKPVPPFDRRPLGTVNEAFITTEIDGRTEMDAARKALECHKTQYQPAQMQALHEMAVKVLDSRTFLRRALSDLPRPATRERDIFEGLP